MQRILALVFLLGFTGTAVAQPPLPLGSKYHLLFITDFNASIEPFNTFPPSFPDFGSVQAADWYATEAAVLGGLLTEWNGLDIVYRALISDSTVNARDRMTIEGPVYNTQFDLLALDDTDLWDGALQNPVRYDQFGTEVPDGTRVWTGSTQDGNHGISCSNWSNTGGEAQAGDPFSTSTAWLNTGERSCSLSARLYGISPPLEVVPEPGTFWGLISLGTILFCPRRRSASRSALRL